MKILTYFDAINFLEIGKAYKVKNATFSGVILVLSINSLVNSDRFAIVCGFNLSKFIFTQGIYAVEIQDVGMLNTVYEKYKENPEQFLKDIGSINFYREF